MGMRKKPYLFIEAVGIAKYSYSCFGRYWYGTV
jgi:hypothetical protein